MPTLIKSRQAIQQLSRQLANQIAAGEVVERPASVVKELLENSLDAAATKIDIDIRDGGIAGIRITDNGGGIPRDELQLALSPHATSKIISLDDLVHVMSMGFRGEALASIASVSELSLTSFYDDMAWTIKANQGQFEISPASHPQGTTLEVNNLFFNTPARRKFLRSQRTEYRYVEDVVKRIALARFDVAFNFRHNQRQVFSLAAAKTNATKIQRLARLINKEFIQSAVALDFESAGIKLWGWLASADYSRSQSDMQYFFVNGRMIRDKVITHAVRQAFASDLHPGRFPVYVLHLEMDPEQVDVNVHPTKHEVRFRQSRLIHDFLYNSLQQALISGSQVAQLKTNTVPGMSPSSSLADQFLQTGYSQSYSPGPDTGIADPSSAYHFTACNEGMDYPLGCAIAKIKNDYLVAQNKNGVLLVSLSRARKCSIKNKLNTHLSERASLVSKPVLLPFSIKLQNNAQGWLDKNIESLKRFGFEFSVFGEQDIMVRQVPAILHANDLKQALYRFIEILETNTLEANTIDLNQVSRALLEVIINEDFSQRPEDWNRLLRELEQLDDISGLYHQLSEEDFAKWFS